MPIACRIARPDPLLERIYEGWVLMRRTSDNRVVRNSSMRMLLAVRSL